jgi:hypothetical protein
VLLMSLLLVILWLLMTLLPRWRMLMAGHDWIQICCSLSNPT